MAVEHGTGDKLDGNLMSREEKQLKRVQVENGDQGDGKEEDRVARQEEGCTRATSLRAIGEGSAVPKGEGPCLTAGGRD